MIRILLVDDQALLCEVLKTWLEVEQDLQVVGVAHNGKEAIAKVEMLHPDIVLMDIDMPHMDGFDATKIISERFPKVKVIFLSGHDDDVYLGKSLRAGAKGYLLKNTTADELVNKIRSVYNDYNLLLEPTGDRDTVVALQTQLEELIETYRHKFQKQLEEYKASIEDANPIQQLDQKYEKRLENLEKLIGDRANNQLQELEYKNQSSWESIRQEIINVNTQFNQANRNLSSQFNQQLVNLKKDLDSQLANALDDWSRQRAALQEWAVQRDEMRPSAEAFESGFRNELMSVVNPIRTSVRDLNRQMQIIRKLVIASSLFATIALTFSSCMLISDFRVQSPANSPANEIEK